MIHPNASGTGWTRKSVNKQINRIRQMFKWAVENEMVPMDLYHGLTAVVGLKAGRCEARESEPVRPVPDAHVYAVQDKVSKQIATMIHLQLLTGARPGEVCVLRALDIDRSGKVWIYRPQTHKTSHYGYAREIRIGPKAQKFLVPFLAKLDLGAFIFSPVDAEASRREFSHRQRKTPQKCGNRPGSNRRNKPKWAPGERYSVSAYRRAVERGCDLAFPPPVDLARLRVAGAKGTRWETDLEWQGRLGANKWASLLIWRREHRWHPHQLRHNAATRLRREHGVEMARIILGHRNLSATEIYAEADTLKATQIMEQAG
jgi:integrase